MSWFDDYLASLPQTRFNEIRDARYRTDDPAEQQRLSIEDRRAYAREQAYEKGIPGVLQQGLLIPGEQLVKSLGLLGGRSGFHSPFQTIGAGYNGLLQGLNDRRTGYDPR